jgi:tRNA-splicing ligase RtcB (3'-phosphate/5'-hydroxy nucleic acid ligase)
MPHAGVGNRMAQHHIGVARDLMTRYWIDLPDPDLAYLAEGTKEFETYLRDLRWAQHFALLNRDEMMDRVVACASDWFGTPVVEHERIQCHHNFTSGSVTSVRDVWLSPSAPRPARPSPPTSSARP